jgi:hypothetical protein
VDRGKDIPQKDGFLACFDPELSASDTVRAKMRLLIWFASGHEGDIYFSDSVSLGVTSIPQEEAVEALRWMTAVFEATRRFGIGFTKRGVYNRTPQDSTELLSVCYRGVDRDFAGELISISNGIVKDFKNLWEEKDDGALESITEGCRYLAECIVKGYAEVAFKKSAETAKGAAE